MTTLPVFDWLAHRAALSPNRIALTDQSSDLDISYAAWNQRVDQSAHFLRSLGVGVGDRVAILSMNTPAYLDVLFACNKLGAILQNLNWRLATSELVTLVNDASPKVLFYGEDFFDATIALQKSCHSVETWIAIGKRVRDSDFCGSERNNAALMPFAMLPRDAHDPWVICYTGGTTGLPKGAMLSHANILANALSTTASWGLSQDDVAILNAPLFHVGGLNVFTTPLVYLGGRSIVCRHFDVDMVFDLIKHQGVTVFFGVPTMFLMMQEHPRWQQADFSGLKFVISGGAPCPRPVFEKFWVKGVSFTSGYGLTEAGPNNFWMPASMIQAKPGSVGRSMLHLEHRLVDEEGKDVAAGGTGELLIRGPHVIQGYWQNPEATSAAIRDGWLHTGDLARCDEEGYYTIAGRLKDMIISGGENIYPAEIESVLHSHDAIAEAAVIGVPDKKWGEVGLAVIRLLPDTSLDAAQTKLFCQERLARYKVPRRFLFVDVIPKTSAGKIDKKALVATYA